MFKIIKNSETHRVLPWSHGIKLNDGKMSAEQIIHLAGMDWFAKKEKMKLVEDNKVVTTHYAVVRSDNRGILGVVGQRYMPLQNQQAFGFFDEAVDRNQAVYESAGIVDGGVNSWIVSKLPQEIKVGDNDIIDCYVILMNNFDGTRTLSGKIVPILRRYNISLPIGARQGEFKIKHTKSAGARMHLASKLIADTTKTFGALDNMYQGFNTVKLTAKEVDTLLAKIFGDSVDMNGKVRTRVVETKETIKHTIYSKFSTQATAWSLYASVCEYVDHGKVTRDLTDHLFRVVYGSGAITKGKALSEIKKFIGIK
jgi:phage/plasmid-like protein (TIGR03299 family)